MREIKFRGIATVNDKYNDIKVGDFVYGCFVETNIDCQVLFGDGEQISIDRKTIGQFTGLTDKNGVGIYEGDVLCVTKREMFAMHAMQGILSNSGGVIQGNNYSGTGWCNSDANGLAKWSLECADALLAELEKQQ